jgi:hypothetical protein
MKRAARFAESAFLDFDQVVLTGYTGTLLAVVGHIWPTLLLALFSLLSATGRASAGNSAAAADLFGSLEEPQGCGDS